MTTSARFWPIEEKDIPGCAEVFVEVFGSEPWNEQWHAVDAQARLEEMVHTPGFHGVLAASDEEMLGFAMGHTEQWQRGTKHFYLQEICVRTEHQRCGLGSGLMHVLCQDLTAMDVEAIYLLTARDGPAQAFYERLGFDANPGMIMMGKYLDERGTA
ncbi:MAG: GNAT family N-acetyltransferase [Anaerolineae bacterium]|nr:GNAT family N-acetyltransferase [Anaerolineae bacterium]